MILDYSGQAICKYKVLIGGSEAEKRSVSSEGK